MNFHLVNLGHLKKNFRFHISEKKSNSTFAKIFATLMHNDNVFCAFSPDNLYHVLFDMYDDATE